MRRLHAAKLWFVMGVIGGKRLGVLTVLGVAAALLLAGVGGRTASDPAGWQGQEKKTFTVATYNIYYRNRNLKAVAAAIRKSKADLVVLQETNRESRKYLRAELGRSYPHMYFRLAKHTNGFGFLSTVALRKLRFLPPRHGLAGSWIGEVTLGGRAVEVANVHLISYLPRAAKDLKDLLTCLWRTGGIQQREISRLHEVLSREMPVMVVGDFNNTADLGGPAYLKACGFIDSLASVANDPAKHATWHSRHRDVHWRFRLDYIFHTAAIKTHSSRVIPAAGSDHYLVVSTLGWSAAAGNPAGGRTVPPVATGPAR